MEDGFTNASTRRNSPDGEKTSCLISGKNTKRRDFQKRLQTSYTPAGQMLHTNDIKLTLRNSKLFVNNLPPIN